MIDYEKVFKTIAYLIETMNGFQDGVLKYKYNRVLISYKNYIESYKIRYIKKEFTELRYIKKNAEKHLNYMYFPHLEEEAGIVFDDTVGIITHSQLQHDLLVKAGMNALQQPSDSFDGLVTFRVTSEVGEKYNSLYKNFLSE